MRPQLPLRGLLAFAAVLAVLALSLAWWVWPTRAVPQSVAVDLAGADPSVAAAITAAQSAVQRAPASAATWGRLGMVLQAHDFRSEATTCFAQAERLDPANPRWPYYQAIDLLISAPEEGLACLKRAVALGGPVSTPRLLLGEVLLAQGRGDEAEQHFRLILKTEPANPRALHGLGRLAYASGDLPASLKHLQASLREAPWVLGSHALLAEIHFRLGNPPAAEEERRLAEGLRADTPWPDPYLEEVAQYRVGPDAQVALASQLLQQGRAGEAVDLLRETLARQPDHYDGWMALGKVFLRMQPPEYRLAEEAFREATRRRSDDPAAPFHLGIALERQQNFAAAADYYARAVELKPDYAYAHYNRGQCLKQLADRAGALQAFQKAVRYKPNFAEAHRELGELLAETGQRDNALEELHQAVQLSPTDALARRLLEDVRARRSSPQ